MVKPQSIPKRQSEIARERFSLNIASKSRTRERKRLWNNGHLRTDRGLTGLSVHGIAYQQADTHQRKEVLC